MAVKGLLMLPMKKGADEQPADDLDDEGDAASVGKLAAAEDVMDALKRNDKKAFAVALEDFIECCHGEHAGGEDTESE